MEEEHVNADTTDLAKHRKTRTGMEQKTFKMDRIASSKDKEKEEHLSQRCGADKDGMICLDGAEMASRKDYWKLRGLNVKLQVDSTPSDKVPRASDIKQPAVSSTPTEEPGKPASYNRNSQSITGQKKASLNHDLDKEKEKREPRLRATSQRRRDVIINQ